MRQPLRLFVPFTFDGYVTKKFSQICEKELFFLSLRHNLKKMVVTFDQTYLKELFVHGRCSDKKHRYQPEIVKRYQRRIEQLQAATSPDTLRLFNSLNFEALKGDKAGLFSVRVNDKYRIEFSMDVNSDSPILTVCNIVELSNHYD